MARVSDQVTDLGTSLHAYLALEKLISPEHLEDADESLSPTRAELGALLRSVNQELQRQINQLADSSAVLLTRMRHDADPG